LTAIEAPSSVRGALAHRGSDDERPERRYGPLRFARHPALRVAHALIFVTPRSAAATGTATERNRAASRSSLDSRLTRTLPIIDFDRGHRAARLSRDRVVGVACGSRSRLSEL
jgi:hypothetical protein